MAPTKQEARTAIRMRKAGASWAEVCDAMGKPIRWQVAVRPLMKELAPETVAPSYDRAKVARRRRRSK